MAKFTLDTDPEDHIDFLLIGIVSHAKPYRLCWSLNKIMNFNLVKTEEKIELNNARKKQQFVFEIYNFEDEESRINYYLIPNKSGTGYLIPELKHVDFLLVLKENLSADVNSIIDQIRQSDQVMTCFEINTEEVKSLENLLF